jgi:hypothetical protein
LTTVNFKVETVIGTATRKAKNELELGSGSRSQLERDEQRRALANLPRAGKRNEATAAARWRSCRNLQDG